MAKAIRKTGDSRSDRKRIALLFGAVASFFGVLLSLSESETDFATDFRSAPLAPARYITPMIRRWLIRSLALLLLTLCVVAWVGSYWHAIEIDHDDETSISLIMGKGRAAFFLAYPSDKPPSWHPGWRLPTYPIDVINWSGDSDVIGFRFHHSRRGWSLMIPLYFPTLLSAFLLWLVWRKTRAKPIGGAFPVEAKSNPTPHNLTTR